MQSPISGRTYASDGVRYDTGRRRPADRKYGIRVFWRAVNKTKSRFVLSLLRLLLHPSRSAAAIGARRHGSSGTLYARRENGFRSQISETAMLHRIIPCAVNFPASRHSRFDSISPNIRLQFSSGMILVELVHMYLELKRKRT